MAISYKKEVQKKYPKSEAYKIGFGGFGTWAIGKEGSLTTTIGQGNTKSMAWKDAWENKIKV